MMVAKTIPAEPTQLTREVTSGFKVDREELAWAAGFFDGEGHVSLLNEPRRRHLTLRIAQVGDCSNLDRFQCALGFGSIAGPYRQNDTRWPVYHFVTGGYQRVQAAIAMLWFKLGNPKRTQARKALVGAQQYHLNRQAEMVGKSGGYRRS